MEFRYRAIDGDRPPTTTDTSSTQSPNPSFSFLSAPPPIPGCKCNVGKSEDHAREAIQREIEKEQIRQEIIAAETARRRELIAEVAQEMAIEREMAIRRVTETGMWMNQKKLLPTQIENNNLFGQNQNLMNTVSSSLVTSPMIQSPPLEQQMPEATGTKATSIMESNKDKLIVLNRPDHIGTKRKAEEDTETGLEIAKRKARDPNLVGTENKEKETVLRANETSVNSGETVLKLSSGKKEENKSKGKYKFWCEICRVGALCETVMRSHELGKKHIAAIKKQNKTHETTSTDLNNITAPVQSEANVEDQQKVDEKVAVEKNKKETFWCEICNIPTYSEQVMKTHKFGKKHKTLLKKQQNQTL